MSVNVILHSSLLEYLYCILYSNDVIGGARLKRSPTAGRVDRLTPAIIPFISSILLIIPKKKKERDFISYSI